VLIVLLDGVFAGFNHVHLEALPTQSLRLRGTGPPSAQCQLARSPIHQGASPP
jgi:hypothetical protein